MNAPFVLTTGLIGLALFAAESKLVCEGSETKLGPGIQLDSEVFRFGQVKQGQLVKHDFVFTNTGTATLELSDVKPGCGCTTAGEWTRTVQPGKTGVVPLQFNSAGFGGDVVKSATIFCNDPQRSNVVLQLTGTVWVPIEVTPAVVVFQPCEEDQTSGTKIVRIHSNLGQRVKLSVPECTGSSLRAKLKTTKPGEDFELQVTVVPPFSSRYLSGSITMKTSSSEAPLVAVNVSIVVQPVLTLIPQQIAIARGPLAGALTSFVTIVNNSKGSITFSDPKANLPQIGVHFHEPGSGQAASVVEHATKTLKPGEQLTIAISFPAGFQLPSNQKVEATLKTTHPKIPQLRIPIVGMSFSTGNGH